MKFKDTFNICVKIKKIKGGGTQVDCVKGLWGVSASTDQDAIREAMNYFLQYHQDGEYEDIINNAKCDARDELIDRRFED